MQEFRGKKMVNIREFYEKNGELLPGRKGIAITNAIKYLSRCITKLNCIDKNTLIA